VADEITSLLGSLEFHHIGYATNDIEDEYVQLQLLGYTLEGNNFIDTTQGIKGVFITGGGPRIELLENLPGSNTLTPWLNANTKVYHIAYHVDDIEYTIEQIRQFRARLIVSPVASIAFSGRKIAFVMLRSCLMIEFIEKEIKV